MPHQNFDLSSLYLIKDETQVILKDAEKHLSEYSDDIDAAPCFWTRHWYWVN